MDYENAQFLLIGSSTDDLGEATEQQPKDEKADKDTPLEEMEKLENEDTARVEHLKGLYNTDKLRFLSNVFNQMQRANLCQGTIPSLKTWASARKSIPKFRLRGSYFSEVH